MKRATPREQDKKGYGGGHHFSGRGGGRGNPQFYHHHGEREMQPHFAPYGGHAAYYPYYPPTPGYPGGGYMGGYGSYGGGYGGYGSYDQYGGGRRDDAGENQFHHLSFILPNNHNRFIRLQFKIWSHEVIHTP